jgi:hypothetical protein
MFLILIFFFRKIDLNRLVVSGGGQYKPMGYYFTADYKFPVGHNVIFEHTHFHPSLTKQFHLKKNSFAVQYFLFSTIYTNKCRLAFFLCIIKCPGLVIF